jgi:hypothetical protein
MLPTVARAIIEPVTSGWADVQSMTVELVKMGYAVAEVRHMTGDGSARVVLVLTAL